MSLSVELLILLVLLVANGVFAMAEIAVVSSRKARLKALADQGSERAKAALRLAEEPTAFLSSVQVGITLVGILAGAFGGARLAGRLESWLVTFPPVEPFAPALSMGLVVGAITFLSLVIGELVPKRIALGNPEARAMLVARPMTALARVASPLVSLLTRSTEAVLKAVGLGGKTEAPPSEEEIAHLIEQGTHAGVFHQAERAMVEGVLRLDEREVTEIMTRRNHIVWLDVDDSDEVNWRKMVNSRHSHFPVHSGSRDNVLGLVSVKSMWANAAAGLPNNLRDHLTPPLVVPGSVSVVQLLETFKRSGRHLALVTDEFGSVQGLVTLIDVMEAIVGDLPEPGDRQEPAAVRRDDGSWLVDGAMAVREFRQQVGLDELPGEDEEAFETVGGFVLHRLGHIPRTGESFAIGDRRFEVVDMDRHRVDKVLVSAAPVRS